MIAHLQGKLVEKSPTQIIIDCGGVGYHVNISLHTYFASQHRFYKSIYASSNKRGCAYTLDLWKSQSEKFLDFYYRFRANIARTMLSSLDPKQITNAIASADVVTIQSIKGIGKTAQRVILDLKKSVEIV
jgi:Holliday junction DNA helicase RuvA